MITALLTVLALDASAPAAVTIVTAAGERRIPVTTHSALGLLVPAGATLTALGGTSGSDGVWAEVRVGSTLFRFLLGAPTYSVGTTLFALASTAATVRSDTLFLPLQFLSEALPRHLSARFRWDPKTARLVDGGDRSAPAPGTKVVSSAAKVLTRTWMCRARPSYQPG